MGKQLPDNETSEYQSRLKDEWIDYERMKRDNLTFSVNQIAWFDEIHIGQVVGIENDETLIFSRGDDGIYNEDAIFDENEEKNRRVSV